MRVEQWEQKTFEEKSADASAPPLFTLNVCSSLASSLKQQEERETHTQQLLQEKSEWDTHTHTYWRLVIVARTRAAADFPFTKETELQQQHTSSHLPHTLTLEELVYWSAFRVLLSSFSLPSSAFGEIPIHSLIDAWNAFPHKHSNRIPTFMIHMLFRYLRLQWPNLWHSFLSGATTLFLPSSKELAIDTSSNNIQKRETGRKVCDTLWQRRQQTVKHGTSLLFCTLPNGPTEETVTIWLLLSSRPPFWRREKRSSTLLSPQLNCHHFVHFLSSLSYPQTPDTDSSAATQLSLSSLVVPVTVKEWNLRGNVS